MKHLRGYEVWLVGHEERRTTVNHRNAARAKYEYLLSVGDAFPDGLPWALVRCRALGSPADDADLARIVATYGRPDIVVGVAVEHDGSRGVVAGASGGYVSVLFDGCRHTLPCHPGEIVLAAEEERP